MVGAMCFPKGVRSEEIMNIAFTWDSGCCEHGNVPSSAFSAVGCRLNDLFGCNLNILDIKTRGRVQ